jgi:ADP-heptose:LPS heptosyltransferase
MTRRVLIHRMGSLGDTVVALPCFHLIRASFPDCEVRVLTNAPVADPAPPLFAVLEGSGLIDGYFEYPVALRSWRSLWRLSRAIAAWRPDIAIYLVRRSSVWQVLRDAIFLLMCRCGKIVGLPWSREQREGRVRADGLREREAERLARCVAPLGDARLDAGESWDLRLTEIERAAPCRMIPDYAGMPSYMVLCIGTKQAMKEWAGANWRAVAEHLLKTYPVRLVFVGADADYELSDRIAADSAGRCVNLCGRLTVRESAGVIAGAVLFVGIDSGPMHLAAAVGTPLVAVFSTQSPPGPWFPLGDRVRVLYPYAPGATIASITPTDVVTAVAGLLPNGLPGALEAGS